MRFPNRKQNQYSGFAALLIILSSTSASSGSKQAAYRGSVSPLAAQMRTAMTGKSWRTGCPVPLDDLAAVQVTYFGFDGLAHEGTLVVHKRLASEVASIFEELYAIRFPINKVSAWDDYGPDVYAEQNITVGFYCEKADDAPGEWSSHAYGFAIDINPLLNPFLDLKHSWWPRAAAKSAPRDGARGKISTDTEAFRIFTRHGWAWGGFDPGVPDYMHFGKATVGGDGNRLERPYAVTHLQYVPGGAQEMAQPK
jgi:D-alanyl-D-alanine carboxypeptidase